MKPSVLRGVQDLKGLSIGVVSRGSSKLTCKPPTVDKLAGVCGAAGGGGGKGHQITYKPYVAPCYKDHDHKNMGLKRPMSPHLTVYGPTVPSMTSIAQRITGTILTSYAILISGGTLFLSNGIDTYVSMIQSLDLSRPLLFILKVLLGAPFAYHYFCGIRFCAWNAGKWLDMKTVYSTARQSFILTAAVALFFALL